MFKVIANAWRIPELRKKILFTLLVILLFRVGAAIPVPFLDIGEAGILTQESAGTFMEYLTMMTGDAFNYGTIFAMSITPYINSSIIMQLLTVAIPALERLSKEGEEGRKKIASITRYVTMVLGLIQSTAYYIYLKNQGYLLKSVEGTAYTGFPAVFQAFVIIGTFVGGTALIMWLGERINEKGIGNGISIILVVGIVSQGYNALMKVISMPWWAAIIVLVVCVLIIAFIVYITEAERRIPVQYAKRVVGRKQYGGQSSNLPMKVNMAGVMPVIFASTICGVPGTLISFFGDAQTSKIVGENGWFRQGAPIYIIIYVLLIFAFAYFYSAIQFNPIEVANNLKKQGGFIPGFRPGKPTSDFIARVLNKITMMGAIFLAIIAGLPLILSNIPNLYGLAIGGTSTMIMVGVALETVRAIESEMMMRHYKGVLE